MIDKVTLDKLELYTIRCEDFFQVKAHTVNIHKDLIIFHITVNITSSCTITSASLYDENDNFVNHAVLDTPVNVTNGDVFNLEFELKL